MGAKIRNLAGFQAMLAQVPAKVKARVHDTLIENAEEFVGALKRNYADAPGIAAAVAYTEGTQKGAGSSAPTVSGVLAEEGLGVTVYVGAPEGQPLNTAVWREFGTAPHKEKPKTAKALRLSADGEDYASVDNPGQAPRPVFYPTYRAYKKRFRNRLAYSGRKAVKDAISS